MKEVLTGRKYRHFKGGVYEVLGISTPGPSKGGVIHTPTHSEIEPKVVVEIREGWYHDPVYPDTLVVYRGDSGTWARPIQSFQDEADGTERFALLPAERPKTPEELRKERFKKEIEPAAKKTGG